MDEINELIEENKKINKFDIIKTLAKENSYNEFEINENILIDENENKNNKEMLLELIKENEDLKICF